VWQRRSRLDGVRGGPRMVQKVGGWLKGGLCINALRWAGTAGSSSRPAPAVRPVPRGLGKMHPCILTCRTGKQTGHPRPRGFWVTAPQGFPVTALSRPAFEGFFSDLYDPASLACSLEKILRIRRQPRISRLRDKLLDHLVKRTGAITQLEKRGGTLVQWDDARRLHQDGLCGRRSCVPPFHPYLSSGFEPISGPAQHCSASRALPHRRHSGGRWSGLRAHLRA